MWPLQTWTLGPSVPKTPSSVPLRPLAPAATAAECVPLPLDGADCAAVGGLSALAPAPLGA